MNHLTDIQLVDALEGSASGALGAHLETCAGCRARLEELRETLRDVAADPGELPSPLYWDHFAARVNAAIDTPEARRAGPGRALLWWGAAAAAALLLLVAGTTAIWRAAPEHVSAPVGVAEAPVPATDDLDADEAWALVRTAAEDLDYEAAREAGVAPRAGALERAAMELTAEERAELARLIEAELKRNGA